MPHLANYADIIDHEFDVDILDAIELRLVNRHTYLQCDPLGYVSKNFGDLINTRHCQALAASLLALGVPVGLVEITVCDWVTQWAYVVMP